MHFEENPWSVAFGDDWIYTHDLLWRVWRDYPQSEWGELAFVLLQNRGWDTRPACPKGTDQFREVIRRGEEFLRGRPASSHRAMVLLRLGQAYQTWWSLAQAVDSTFGDSPSYQDGDETARESAIGYYEELLRLEAEGPKADYARAHLPRLRQRVDTNQRQYFCVFQD